MSVISHYSAAKTRSKSLVLIEDLIKILGCSILIGLFAKISIPLPFTPVPIATQPQVILGLAVLLGGKRAALATAAFIVEGLIGMPVFSGGKFGLCILLGPTGGYLIGYIAAAYIAGNAFEKAREKSAKNAFYSMVKGNIMIYIFGFMWLSKYLGTSSAFALGVAPFIIGDFIKLILATKLIHKS